MFYTEAFSIFVGATVLVAGGAGEVDVHFVGCFVCPGGEDIEGASAFGNSDDLCPPFGETNPCGPEGVGGFFLFGGAGKLDGTVVLDVATAGEGDGIDDHSAFGGIGDGGEVERDALACGGEGASHMSMNVIATSLP